MERRQIPRLPLSLQLEQVLSEQALGQARTLDVSEAGFRARPLDGELVAEGRFAWWVLQLPDARDSVGGGPIRALAELCRRDAAGLHYRFKYINPRDRRRFESFVRDSATG